MALALPSRDRGSKSARQLYLNRFSDYARRLTP